MGQTTLSRTFSKCSEPHHLDFATDGETADLPRLHPIISSCGRGGACGQSDGRMFARPRRPTALRWIAAPKSFLLSYIRPSEPSAGLICLDLVRCPTRSGATDGKDGLCSA